MSQKNSGTLYLIPTPIGNLDDITLRALSVLKNIDLLLCEDTRHTQILLDHYNIRVPKLSFHEHNSRERIPEVIKKIKDGLDIGLVSDAGMPVISDPGIDLVEKLHLLSLPVVCLPGPNAAITALAGSGIVALPYTFLGFLPRNIEEIKKKLNNIFETTIIFYESPYRLLRTLKIIAEIDEHWFICVARELTKIHEEYYLGEVCESIDYFKSKTPKGEFVVILKPRTKVIVPPNQDQWQIQIDQLIENGFATNQAIKKFAKMYHLERKKVYDVYHKLNHKELNNEKV